MRGALLLNVVRIGLRRIIPAYAGSTGQPARVHVVTKDHPRVCGEHPSKVTYRPLYSGSSPRMRGAPCRESAPTICGGIIPAYAGSTPTVRARPTPTRDHPRVCGEHSGYETAFEKVPGSSPRMRGAPEKRVSNNAVIGIIPAYAGSTLHVSSFFVSQADHPRVCGEHHAHRYDIRDWRWIIPAYAGSTSPTFWKRVTSKDHPRVCGEHTSRSASLR